MPLETLMIDGEICFRVSLGGWKVSGWIFRQSEPQKNRLATRKGYGSMKVLVGVRCLIQPKTGIGHYTEELLGAMGQLTEAPTISRFPGNGLLGLTRLGLNAAKVLRNWTKRSSKANSGSPRLGGASGHPGWLEKVYDKLLERELDSGKYDLYHEPNYFAHPTSLPTVVTVCDLSALLHPDWHPADRVRRHEQLFRWLVPSGAHFLTISEFVKNEMIQVLGVDSRRIHVTCCGVRDHLRPLSRETVDAGLKRLGLPRGYFLHVGTVEPRKNLGLLLRAWADLPGNLRTKHPLVLVGGIGWEDSTTLDLIRDLKPKGLIHMGYLAEADLPVVYGGARAFVYPSHYEGFGMPPVEMLACGGAVLSAPAGAVEEVASPAAHIIRSSEIGDWREALAEIATDNEWHEQLTSKALETASRHTWKRCAELTLLGYQKTLAPKSQAPEATRELKSHAA